MAPSSPPGCVPADGRLDVDVSEFHEETTVQFAQLSDELLWDYIDSGEPMCVSQRPEAAAPHDAIPGDLAERRTSRHVAGEPCGLRTQAG